MKIPIYDAKEQLGGPKTYPVRQKKVFKDPMLEAGKKSIGMLEQRHLEIENERDQMEVVKAIGSLNDAERLFIANEEERPVGDSAGSLNRGGDWYKKTINDISGGLRSKNAKEMFTVKAESLRSNGLDRLAGDMAKKHNLQRKGEIDGIQANIFGSISVGTTADKLDEDIKELHGKITGFYKGVNADLIKFNSKTAIINAFLKDKALSDPEEIAGLLKRYNKDLSGPDSKAISDMAVKSIKGLETSDLYDNIKSLYKTPETALAASYSLKATDRSPGVVEAVRAMLKDEFVTYGQFKDTENKRVQEQAEIGAVNLWANDNYVALRQHIMKTMVDPARVEHWIDKINTAEKAIVDGGDNPYNDSQVQVKALITGAIMTAPNTLTQKAIWELNGHGLSTKDCVSLTEMWEARSVKGANPKEVEVANILKWYRQGNQFDSDVVENQQIHDRLLNDCFAWSSANPEGDVVEYMKSKLNALEEYGWWSRRTDAFKGFFGFGPGTDEPPMNPVLPGDLEEMVGWGNPDTVKVKKTIKEDPTHKARRILDEALGKHIKEK